MHVWEVKGWERRDRVGCGVYRKAAGPENMHMPGANLSAFSLNLRELILWLCQTIQQMSQAIWFLFLIF